MCAEWRKLRRGLLDKDPPAIFRWAGAHGTIRLCARPFPARQVWSSVFSAKFLPRRDGDRGSLFFSAHLCDEFFRPRSSRRKISPMAVTARLGPHIKDHGNPPTTHPPLHLPPPPLALFRYFPPPLPPPPPPLPLSS